MEINENNKEEYIRRVLKRVIKNYSYKWLTEDQYKKGCNIEKTLNKCSKNKMYQIKQYIYEAAYIHENLWFVYKEIKEFKDIKELLTYISNVKYYDPETILLQLVRGTRKLRVKNDDKTNNYKVNMNKTNIPQSEEKIKNYVKTFIRSYCQILFNVQKQAIELENLYKMFLNERISHITARQGNVIEYFKKRHYTLKEIITFAENENFKTPSEIFIDIIKSDYNHFIKIIEDYYGSKHWDEETMFKAKLKVYDEYLHNGNKEKVYELGEELIEKLDESGMDERAKRRLYRLINRKRKKEV